MISSFWGLYVTYVLSNILYCTSYSSIPVRKNRYNLNGHFINPISCTNVKGSSTTVDLESAVRERFSQNTDGLFPVISTGETVGILRINENVTFTTDLIKGQGIDNYNLMRQSWVEGCNTELFEANCSISRLGLGVRVGVRG
jgi:hypothetical protein